MSFETKEVVARLDAAENELMEIRQSLTVVSMALIRLTEVVEQAAKVVETTGSPGLPHEEDVAEGYLTPEEAGWTLPEAPEGSD